MATLLQLPGIMKQHEVPALYKVYKKWDNDAEIYASGVLSVIQFFVLLSVLYHLLKQ